MDAQADKALHVLMQLETEVGFNSILFAIAIMCYNKSDALRQTDPCTADIWYNAGNRLGMTFVDFKPSNPTNSAK